MKKNIIILLSFFFIVSCSKNLDFNQARHLEITPVFEGDIFFLDIYKDNLTDRNGFRENVLDTVDFGIFGDGRTRDAFIKAEIYVKFKNTFQRNFTTIVSYQDENYHQVEADTLQINIAQTGQAVEGEEVYTYEKVTNPEFVNFRKIVIKVVANPNLLPVEDESLHIQTKGVFYTKYVVE